MKEAQGSSPSAPRGQEAYHKKTTRTRERVSARPRAEKRHKIEQRRRAFNGQVISIEDQGVPTTETCRQADLFFDERKLSGPLGKRKLDQKKRYFRKLFHAGKIAYYYAGFVMYPRRLNHPQCSRLKLKVIDTAVDAGLFIEIRSKPGSPKMSRLMPTGELAQHATIDPWTFDPATIKQFVILRDRNDKEEIPFDSALPTPADVQKRLEPVNHVNGLYEILYEKWDRWEQNYIGPRCLRPVHYAIFTGSFDRHGRIYTGKYGHQSLLKNERKTIRFNGEPSVEHDFGGMHPRLLYHLEGINYQDDPYALWGGATTSQKRLMAKAFINALINAECPQAAISACNFALSTKTKYGKQKTGKALEDARNLNDASEQTGIRFADLLPLVQRCHKRIEHHFGHDRGVELMRIDSSIALNVLHYFAERCIPCLSCHDSFIVPQSAGEELFKAMYRFYRDHVGFPPKIKRGR